MVKPVVQGRLAVPTAASAHEADDDIEWVDASTVDRMSGDVSVGALKAGVAVERGLAKSNAVAGPTIGSKADVERLIGALVEASFPELAEVQRDGRISVSTFESDAYFFESSVRTKKILNTEQRSYVVRYNQAKVDGRLSECAARGVLAHELCHTLLYETTGFQGMLRTLWYGLFSGLRWRLERRTDLEAIRRGYADELKAFRNWAYDQLGEDELIEKRTTYFTPDEIDEVSAALESFPGLGAFWQEHPPSSRAEIIRDLERHKRRHADDPKKSF